MMKWKRISYANEIASGILKQTPCPFSILDVAKLWIAGVCSKMSGADELYRY